MATKIPAASDEPQTEYSEASVRALAEGEAIQVVRFEDGSALVVRPGAGDCEHNFRAVAISALKSKPVIVRGDALFLSRDEARLLRDGRG